MELIRTLILLVGWPILIGGSVFLFYRTYQFYVAVQKNVWGKLVLTMVIGWLITMYSLGLVSTVFLFIALRIGTYVVLPIFGMWFFTMILITRIVLRWNREAVQVNKFNMQLQTLVDEKTRDLSHEKQTVEEERNKLKVVISSITDGILAIDPNHTIILVNVAMESVTGYKQEDLIGKKVFETLNFFENGAELREEELFPVPKGDGLRIQKGKIKLKGKDTEKHITLTVSQLKKGGDVNVGFIMTLHDTTKEQELEEMKLDFVSMAAHELRTPLTSIRGYVALLKEECAEGMKEEGKDYISRLEMSSANLGRLIDNLLSISRIERNMFKIDLEPLDLVPVIKTTITNILQQALAKRQTLTFNEPQKSIPVVMADEFRIGQVMTNLIANAIHYTQDEGKISITVEEKPDCIEVTVADNGQGIPKDALPKLFTKFFRVSGVLEQGSKGTGLGLYITKSIIDMHKGEIWVESEEGKGSTLRFKLPIATEEDIAKYKLNSINSVKGRLHSHILLN